MTLHDQPLLECQALCIGYRQPILPPLDIVVRRGRLLVVVGRNGSGKTTWFKTLLGLTPPLGGKILRHVPDLRTTYVPQVAALDAILPVRARDVVAWGRLRGFRAVWPFASAKDREVCKRALVEAEAQSFADRPYGELSEGQKQRILFARMIAADADLVLLDEPTAAMDPVAERTAYRQLAALAHERQKAMVVVSHALGAAAEVADEVLWLDCEGGHVRHGGVRDVLADDAFGRQYGVHARRARESVARGIVPNDNDNDDEVAHDV